MKIRLSGNDSNVYATSVRFMRQIFFQIRDEFVRVAFILPIARDSRDSIFECRRRNLFSKAGRLFDLSCAHRKENTKIRAPRPFSIRDRELPNVRDSFKKKYVFREMFVSLVDESFIKLFLE